MKAKSRLLNYLFSRGVINEQDYYCITITSPNIQMQGHFKADKVKRLQTIFKCNFTTDDNGFLQIKTNNFHIVLT